MDSNTIPFSSFGNRKPLKRSRGPVWRFSPVDGPENYKTTEKHTFIRAKMKLLPIIIAVTAAQDDKRIPPKHPLIRLNQLERFALEWLDAQFGKGHQKAEHWSGKFQRNTQRMRHRFETCGADQKSRKRREASKKGSPISRLDKNNPVKALKQITTGYRKWAERFLKPCPKQPATQAERSRKWNVVLRQRYEDHQIRMNQ